MQLLALDFDGVVCDSIREVLAVSCRAYLRLEPGAGSVRDLAREEGHSRWYRVFQDLLPLGNRAEDFGVALAAIQGNVPIANQQQYDIFYRSFPREWLERYHRVFYRCREELREGRLDRWLELHRPMTGFLDILERRSVGCAFALVTAKDGQSVRQLLEFFGASHLFPTELLFDKETGVHKTAHLRALAHQVGYPMRTITFVDDKLNHLEQVAPLGARPVLAGWGYNSNREHRRARELGFQVATLDNADRVLFGG